MIDGPFRAILPRFTAPLTKWYGHLGLTPNHVTAIGFGLAVVSAGLVAMGAYVLAAILWWISRLADGTDGIYARETNQTSDFGGFLDIVLDMAAYSLMVIGFAINRPDLMLAWVSMLFFYVLCITSALALGTLEDKARVAAETSNRSLRLAAGLAEGGETGIAYTVFLLVPGSLGIGATVWILILAWTVVARSLLAHKILAAPNRRGAQTPL